MKKISGGSIPVASAIASKFNVNLGPVKSELVIKGGRASGGVSGSAEAAAAALLPAKFRNRNCCACWASDG